MVTTTSGVAVAVVHPTQLLALEPEMAEMVVLAVAVEVELTLL